MRASFSSVVAIAMLATPKLYAGDFTLDWAQIDWPAGSTAPLSFTLKDQYGFEVDTRIDVVGNFAAGAGIVSPDDVAVFGGGIEALTFIVDAPPNLGRFGDSRAGVQLSFSSNSVALPVDGLKIDTTDLDASDNNAT
ncbi:MAG: hypothetical protein KKI16_01655, partial [Alphaproteobacteria bacterium]|nr:hypothetical protein [Alphaproteobacteria bacterium]